MNDKDIIKITKVDNVHIKNNHNNVMFPLQSILLIESRDGSVRTLDLASQRDMTDIDYFEIIKTRKTKEKTIFKEEEM